MQDYNVVEKEYEIIRTYEAICQTGNETQENLWANRMMRMLNYKRFTVIILKKLCLAFSHSRKEALIGK